MDDKAKNTLPAPQFQKTEYVKKNLSSHSKTTSSSVTHPSANMSSRKFSAVSFLLENSDIIQKIPLYLDPSMFSDDDDDGKVEEEEEEEEEELDEQVEEETLGATGFSVESNESHLEEVSSVMPERSTMLREFNSNSNSRSANPVHSIHTAIATSIESVKTQNENRFQQSADIRSHDIKQSVISEGSSLRVKTDSDSRFHHSADFRSHNVKRTARSEAGPCREKLWAEQKFQGSVDRGSHDPTHLKSEIPSSRFLLKKQDDNTIEDFNWRRKASKPSSHQASFLKKSQPVMEKIDELPKLSSKSSEGHIASSHSTLERAKSHGDLCSHKENVPHVSKKDLSHSVKSHSYVKHIDNVPAEKEKPIPYVSRDTLKSSENQSARQQSCGKTSNDPAEKKTPIPCVSQDALKSSENHSARQQSCSKTSNDPAEKPNVNRVIPNEVITINNKSYLILATLGKGGSCKVYSAYDAGTQSMYAIKSVDLKPRDQSGDQHRDQQIVDGYKKEIEYLKKLKSSDRVIKMFDYEYLETEIRILLEKGDTDFAHYIANEMKMKPLSPIMIKFYWSQMLEAVADIHKLGIVHSDLKPANFLLVAGQLKLIDFGIATSVPADMTSAIRESELGTVNFISPEALTTHYTDNENRNYIIKIGVKSDVWSLGCILYNLVYGHTPFSSIKRMISKLKAIVDDRHEIRFPAIDDPLLLDVLKRCLKRNPKERASVEELLKHPYLTSEAKKEVPSTPIKSQVKFQDMLTQLQSLTPNRMSVVSEVLQKIQSVKKK